MTNESQPAENSGWQQRRPRWFRKRWVWVTALAAVVAGMGIFAAPKLKRAYERRSGASAVKRAADALAKGDIEQAMLNARVALEANPTDAEANRIVAQVLEKGARRSVSKMRINADPRSVEARNNFAFLSLLTRSTEGGIHEIADALYKEMPGNADVLGTYAFSLYQRGKIDEALSTMERLQPGQLRKPGVARYYGIFLTANGRGAEALEYLALGEKGVVLPEEKVLIEKARVAASLPAAKPQ